MLAHVLLALGALAPNVVRAGVPDGPVVAFLASRSASQGADPAVRLPHPAFRVLAGDRLEYEVLVPDPRAGACGLEIAFDDGSHLAVPPAAPGAGWTSVQAPLERFRGRAAVGLELAARGAPAGEIAFYVRSARVARADGSAIELVETASGGGAPLARDLARGAGAALVPGSGPFLARRAAAPHGVREPWAAFDLSGLRRLDPSPLPEERPAPFAGCVYTGPGVPLCFAAAGEPASFAAAGQRITLEPVEGGRFYEIWLALWNETGAEIETRVALLGAERERIEVPLRVPARGDAGYVPRLREGFPAADYALLELDVAAGVSLRTLELPSEPGVRVLAVSACWRRDGASDPRFRARWLARAVESHPELGDSDRADVARYLANRRAGAIFGEVEGEDAAERALFDALIAGGIPRFRAVLALRLDAQAAAGADKKRGRIDLVGALPAGADDLAAALAASADLEGVRILGGVPSALETLAAGDAAALADLRRRIAGDAWRTFGAPWTRGAAARLGAEGLARAIAEGQRSTLAHLGAPSTIALVDADAGRLRHLPVLLEPAGFSVVLLDRGSVRTGAPIVRWNAAGTGVLAVAPQVRIDGPLRLDPSVWRPWAAAVASGARDGAIPVLADLSASNARATAAQAGELAAADLAPVVRWVGIDALAAQARERANEWTPPPPAALADEGARDELAALAAVRRAERSLARLGAVEALAGVDGAAAAAVPIRVHWRRLLLAAALEPARAARAAGSIADAVDAAAQERLEAFRPALPAPGPGIPLLAYDALPWPRRVPIEFPDGALRVRGHDGNDLPGQRTANGGIRFDWSGAGLAPRGLRVRRDPTAALAAPADAVGIEGWTVRNGGAEFEIDPRNGRIGRIRLAQGGVEILTPSALDVAWVRGDEREPVDGLEALDVLERGPLRVLVRRVLVSPRARVRQELAFTAAAPWVEISTRAELVDTSGEIVQTLPVARATRNALLQVPCGQATLAPDPRATRPLDGWVAATDGSATTALLGAADTSFRWVRGAFQIVLAEAGTAAPRDTGFGVLARAGGWKRAGLDAAALERVQRPVLRALQTGEGPGDAREPVVEVVRIEPDGRRTVGGESGLVPLAIEPGAEPGEVLVRVLELRGEPARVSLVAERPPFSARRADFLGLPGAQLRSDGRGVEFTVAPGRCEAVVLRLLP